ETLHKHAGINEEAYGSDEKDIMQETDGTGSDSNEIILLLSCYPSIAQLSQLILTVVLNYALILKNVFSLSIITGLFILQNNAVSQHQREAANGFSMTGMSLFKAFGPAGGGALFSWDQSRINASFLPGSEMVFFVLNMVSVVGLLMTFKPFLALPQQRG
ncbi:hypothetical protein MKX01_032797, partial [Papaver californicum]